MSIDHACKRVALNVPLRRDVRLVPDKIDFLALPQYDVQGIDRGTYLLIKQMNISRLIQSFGGVYPRSDRKIFSGRH